MAEHPNAAMVRAMGEAMGRGDFEALAKYVAEDVEWWEIGSSEPIRGKRALQARSPGNADWGVSFDLHDVVANDDHTIALGEATATRRGETFIYRTAEIFHVKNGEITHRWAFSDDTAKIVAFFS